MEKSVHVRRLKNGIDSVHPLGGIELRGPADTEA
jgi:hypothetical protein